jgi:hypothetical protein
VYIKLASLSSALLTVIIPFFSLSAISLASCKCILVLPVATGSLITFKGTSTVSLVSSSTFLGSIGSTTSLSGVVVALALALSLLPFSLTLADSNSASLSSIILL